MKWSIFVLMTITTGMFCNGLLAAGPNPTPAVLDSTEEAQLIFMREEEKLARDVYMTFFAAWHLNIFANLADSEQRHMDTMLKMLEMFNIDDPVVSDDVGAFSDPDLAVLYPQLISRGDDSALEALDVGAFVEETDIRDLRLAIANTDEPALINAYGNLLAASRNHLRMFVAHIAALGVDYEAQVLDQADADEITGDFDITPGEGFSINSGLNDAWYYPATNGQGFFITVYPELEQIFLAWFTYDVERPGEEVTALLGDPGHRWLTAFGSYSGGLAELEIEITSGGVFDSTEPVVTQISGGSIVLQFDNCMTGSVTYDIPSINRQGVVPIQRIALDNVANCQLLNGGTQ